MVIRSVALFDGETLREAPVDVTILDDRIAAIDEVDTPAVGTVTPGIIDSHVHVGFHSPAALARNGVTAALDLGWPLEQVRALAAEPGASIRYAGPMLTAPGGYPIGAAWAPAGTGAPIASPDDAKRTVGELIAAGASIVKIAQEPRQGPVLTDDCLDAVVAAAHAQGLLVASHLGSAHELMRALAAGVDVLAHGLWSDEPVPGSALELMRDVIVIPTLRIAASGPRLRSIRQMIEHGATITYGTDLGDPPTTPGLDPHEIALMRSCGMTQQQVLASATSVPADRFGWRGRGRIEVGGRADLVLFDGDLRIDGSAVERLGQVWLAGEPQR